MATRRRVLHLVSGDLWAGAEVMVYTLFDALAADRDVELMALCLNDGVLARKLTALGCDVQVISERTHGFFEIAAAALKRYRGRGADQTAARIRCIERIGARTALTFDVHDDVTWLVFDVE